MIRTFRHKGLRLFFGFGSKAGIPAAHAPRLARILARLNDARSPDDVNVPGWKLHPLKSDAAGRWAVWVTGNWRLTFALRDGDACDVDLEDYH
jgi:proteic killer suppression protein